MSVGPTAGFSIVFARRLDRRAFTLVELLVVMGILAVLAAILLPALGRARESARIVACQTRLRAQLQAHQVYAGNFSDQKPPILYFLSNSAIPAWGAFYTSNTSYRNKPLGQGILVATGYLTFDALLCTGGDMTSDTRSDKVHWLSGAELSGSSFVYYWRDPARIKSLQAWQEPVTYQQMRLSRQMALVMDSNFEAGNAFVIAGVDPGTAWINHPRRRITNIGYIDGAVLSVPAEEAMLRAPCTDVQAVRWWADANAAR